MGAAMAGEGRRPKSRMARVTAPLVFGPLSAVTLGVVVLWPGASHGYGPDARAVACRFDTFCRGADCSGPTPSVARIVLNGDRGRSYMDWDNPLGQAAVLPREGETVHAAPLGDDIWAVFVLSPERDFDFRMTEGVIDAPGFEAGSGQCSAPAPMPEAT